MHHIRILSAGLLCSLGIATPVAGAGAGDPAALTLVESAPVETSLGHDDLPDAAEVWTEMIDGASRRIDLAHFYASKHEGSRLEDVIAALARAAARGVTIRFLASESFRDTYPDTIARLGAVDGIETRWYDTRARMGGVLHAKFMLVDDEAFLGSQNFDWRALEHIQELGLRIRVPELVASLEAVFLTDWALAGGADDSFRAHAPEVDWPLEIETPDGVMRVTPALSPRDWLPDDSLWDLPQLLALIDGAQHTLRLQLLSYTTTSRDGTWWGELDNALRRAAARGVEVQLILADWSKRPGSIQDLQSLQCLRNLEVKLCTIPEWSGGFIPFARVVHAKYLVVDGERAWVGTSNWSKDYFFQSRSVGLVIDGGALPGRLDAFFADNWGSEYVYTVDPSANYEPPRRN